MSCSLRGCSFGKVKSVSKRISYKRKSSKRKSMSKRKSKKSKRRSTVRKFGFEVLRNDQIIRLINGNKVYNNVTCD